MRKALGIVALVLLTMAVTAPSFSAAPVKPTVLSAVVNVDGTLARGVGAVSSEALGVDGQYRVTFSRDVSQCAYVGAGGEATAFPADDAITIGASPSEAGVNAVFIQEYDAILGFDSYSSGFHLIVVC
jgi:hypothetical protein